MTKYDLNQYEQAAIIGFWRMGNPVGIIAAIIDTTHFLVEKTIYDYKVKYKIKD
jgi:hypothetical protein